MAVRVPTTRREFLRGKGLPDATRGLFESRFDDASSDQGFPPPRVGHDPSLITASRRAMACQFQIALPATCPQAIAAASAALDVIDRLEDQMTVYNDSSEVSQINAHGGATPVVVESRLFDLFEAALHVHAETEGAFEIAAGALVNAWGFFRGPKRVPTADELVQVMQRVGSRHITLDRTARTIAFGQPGVELNLGAIGKGYALDRAAELLRSDWNVTSGLLHGGQSSVLAIGSLPDCAGEGNGYGWPVAIGDPHRPGESVAILRLKDCALGTSGATIQVFEVNGRRFGHILDPRTGWPAERQVCVSVVAPTAALADALSTAFFILGVEKASEYCKRHPDVGVVLISEDDQAGARKVSVLGRAAGLVELDRVVTV